MQIIRSIHLQFGTCSKALYFLKTVLKKSIFFICLIAIYLTKFNFSLKNHTQNYMMQNNYNIISFILC